MHDFFTNEGRLNRMPYFLRVSVLDGFRRLAMKVLTNPNSTLDPIGRVLLYLVVIAAITLILLQVLKRFHDMDHTGWYCLLMLVPIFNIALGIFLTFRKGTAGPNRFGPDPLAGGGKII